MQLQAPLEFNIRSTCRSTVASGPSIWGDLPFWLAIAAILTIIGLSISRSSLWIDEGFTAWLTAHHSIASLCRAVARPPADASDRQYPLYLAWIWAWCQLFGNSEFALRAANLPFAGIYVFAVSITSREVFARRFQWIPFAFAPFFWLYVSEARSYLMLTSFATVAVGAAIVYAYGSPACRRPAAWFLLSASLLTLLSNILGLFVFPGLAALLAAASRDQKNFQWSQFYLPILTVGPLLAATTIFYAFTFVGAAGGAELQSMHRPYPSVALAAQVLYEDAGLDGLGPPRNLLREGLVIGRAYLPWLLWGTACITLAAIQSLRKSPDPRFWHLLLAWAAVLTVALAVSLATHTEFLGRHVAAAFPFFLFALMFLVRSRIYLIVLTAVFLVSDFRMTAVSEYWKDDYRAAVGDVIARQRAEAGSIDWAADGLTASYYGLALTYPGSPVFTRDVIADFRRLAAGTYSTNLTPPKAEAMLRRQLAVGHRVYLVLSKRDLYDVYQGWRFAIRRHHAVLIARYRTFEIYVFGKAN